MARPVYGNNVRPQMAGHVTIPLYRPLAPGQNVMVRFVMHGGPSSPPVQQEELRDSMQKKEMEVLKRKENERKAQLREKLTIALPPSITLNSEHGTVSASWNCVTIDGQEQDSVVHYELMKVEEGEGDHPVVLYSGPDARYSFSADCLLPGHTYQFYVMASNDGEKGAASPRALLSFPALCPEKPLAPKVASRAKNNIVLKWSAPKDNGSPITSYSLEWDQCDKEFVEVFQGHQKQFKLNHKFLPATTCHFRLRALNDVGWSDFSENLTFKSGAGVPSSPPQPILIESGVNHLALRWDAPTDNGGSQILSYCLEMNDPNMGYGFRPVYQGEELSYTCSGLQRVSSYHFRVAATNEAGMSQFSASVTFETLPAVPGVPGGPELKSRATSTALHIGWKPPLDNGGAPIESYTVQLDDGHLRSFTDVYTGPELEHTVEGLTPGLAYRCRVHATTKAGHSSWTLPVEMKTQPTPPLAPHGLEVVGKPSQNSITVKLNPPEFDGGATVISYNVEMYKDGLWVKVATVANSLAFNTKGKVHGTPTCTVSPLTPGTLYVFRANCVNSYGPSPFSETYSCCTAVGCPASPCGLEVGNKTANSVHLRWQPSKEFGSPLTGYQLEYSVCGSEQPLVVACTTLAACTFTLKGLSPSSSYSIRIRATSAAGSSEWSSPVECTTLPSHPAPPSSLSVLSRTSTSLLVGWSTPDTHGAPITHYCIEVVSPPLSVCVPATESQYMLNNLIPDTTYKLRVQAENAAGKGPFSAYVHGSTIPAPPTPPKLTLVSVGSQYLKVSWGDKKTSQPLWEYVLQSSTDGIRYHKAYQGTANTHRLNKLHPSTKYYFRVASLYSGVQGEWSEPVQFSTTPSPPPAPKDVVLSQIAPSQLNVSWQNVDSIWPLVYVVQLKTRKTDYQQVYEGTEASCTVNMLASKGLHEACVRAIIRFEVNGNVENIFSTDSTVAQCDCSGEDVDGVKEKVMKQKAVEQDIEDVQSSLQNVANLLKKEKCLTAAFFIGLFALIVGIIIASSFH